MRDSCECNRVRVTCATVEWGERVKLGVHCLAASVLIIQREFVASLSLTGLRDSGERNQPRKQGYISLKLR